MSVAVTLYNLLPFFGMEEDKIPLREFENIKS